MKWGNCASQVGQLLSTVRTVVTTVKERGGGTILLDRQDVEPIEKLLDQVSRASA